MIVKVRIFSRTMRITGENQVSPVIESVRTEAETFLSILVTNNICDIRESWASVGKDNTFSVFHITIYYLE